MDQLLLMLFCPNGVVRSFLSIRYVDFTDAQIRHRIEETYHVILEQLRLYPTDDVWDDTIPCVEALGQMQITAMNTFLADYATGKQARRYVSGSLPKLSFERDRFDLALVSHFLFFYGHHLSADFHG